MSTSDSAAGPAHSSLAAGPRPAKRRAKPPMVYAEWFVVINGLVPIAWIAYDAAYHRLGPQPIRAALHTTGVISVVFLVAALVITPLMRVTRSSRWNAYRRPLGLMGFGYAVAHVLIYIAYDQELRWWLAWQELLARRYLQVGALALVLLLPLAITSTPEMMRRLGFKRWKLLHRLAYVATALAIWHYYLQTKADVRWPLAFAALTAALLAFRLVHRMVKARGKTSA